MINKNGFHYGWIILLLVVMTVTGALGFARFGYTMLYPPMQQGLSLDEVKASDLQVGNLAGYLVFALFCGMLAAKFGPRIIIAIFLGVVAVAMFLTGLADNFIGALAARTLTGIGSAGANVSAMGLVAAWFSSKRRGLATGIAVSGSSFGLLLTGAFIPRILNSFSESGWRYSWFALSLLTLGFAIVAFVFMKNNPSKLGLAPVGASREEARVPAAKPSSSLGWGRIIKSPTVWHLAFIYVLFGFSYIIYMTFYVRYLSGEAGFLKEDAGFFLALIGGASVLSGLVWGWISDRIGRKYSLAMVFGIQALSYIIFGMERSPFGILASSVLFALTAWSIPAIMAAATGDILGPKLAPATLGFITFFFGIGQMLGPFLGGRVAQAYHSFSLVFIIAGCAAALGAVASLFINSNAVSKPKEG
jgi:sugar phosphate permease